MVGWAVASSLIFEQKSEKPLFPVKGIAKHLNNNNETKYKYLPII
jgi:hypothetical protein